MTMEEPGSGLSASISTVAMLPGNNSITSVVRTLSADRLAVPMRSMQIFLAPRAQQIPADSFSLLHRQRGQVSEDVAIDTVELSRVFSFELIKHHEQGHKLTVHIFGTAVGIRLALGGDDNGTEQPGICFLSIRRCARDTTKPLSSTRPAPGPLPRIRKPVVSKSPTGGHRSALVRPANTLSLHYPCRIASHEDEYCAAIGRDL